MHDGMNECIVLVLPVSYQPKIISSSLAKISVFEPILKSRLLRSGDNDRIVMTAFWEEKPRLRRKSLKLSSVLSYRA